MTTVNMFEAKSSLSRLVESIEQGREKEIVIARNGRPAAKLVPISNSSNGARIGIAKGKFVVPASIDSENEKILHLFNGGEPS